MDSGASYVDRAENVVRKANELIANGELAKEMENARRTVEGHDWNVITDEFEQKLIDILDSVTGTDSESNRVVSVVVNN